MTKLSFIKLDSAQKGEINYNSIFYEQLNVSTKDCSRDGVMEKENDLATVLEHYAKKEEEKMKQRGFLPATPH